MKVVVIGAGAAGSMAAYFAAKSGAQVVLVEKNNVLGRKLKITGKGRCNITNASDVEDIIQNIYNNGVFMYSSIYSFTNDDLINLLESYGVKTKVERGNRVFPESDKSMDVIRALEKMLRTEKVQVRYNTEVEEIIMSEDGTKVEGVRFGQGKEIKADSVIIATGGVSYPITGSTGDGLKMGKECGHKVTELNPALIGLETVEKPKEEMVGLNLRNIGIKLMKNDKKIYEDFGELEFKEYGIDGPTVKSASCYAKSFRKNNYKIILDLKPALSYEKLDTRIQRDFKKYMNKRFEDTLSELVHRTMIEFIIEKSGIDRDKIVHQITREERQNLVNLVKGIEFEISRPRPMGEAIVTSGGIETKEINPSTMESKLVSGLYFAGEVIDVDAFTGGYNLQVAFSTGYLAGVNAAEEK